MNHNQWNNTDASATVPAKRRRGRPRKYPGLDLGHGGNTTVSKEWNLNGRNIASPGGIREVNRAHQVDQPNDADDIMVGKVVRGDIDASFDAGYVLTVRVDNSETTLRGVVFKPGHYVPVSAENDVAPGVQMFKRKEIPLPNEIYIQDHNARSKDRNGTSRTAKSPNLFTPESKHESVNLPIGVAVTHPSSGLTPGNQGSIFNNQMGELNSGLAGKIPSKKAILAEEDHKDNDDDSDSDRALSAEPLQAVQPVFHHQPIVPRPLENRITGKMTELLQVLQESMIENQKKEANGLAASSEHKSENLGGPGL